MGEAPARGGSWALTVFAAVAASVAVGFAALYVMRPNAGELGAIKVQVLDDAGKGGNTVHITVAEAPFIQTESVKPGQSFAGAVQFPQPYQLPPHLKLASTGGKRLYEVLTVNEYGFTWTAKPLPDDIRDDGKKEADAVERMLGVGGLPVAQARGQLKPGLVFEDFAWEAKGVRMPLGNLPPRTHATEGKFYSIFGQEGPVMFPLPYASPPHVEITGGYRSVTVISEVTTTGFKWKNVAKDKFGNEGEVQWTAKGVLAAEKK
jgi:hypothetical protein